MYGAIFWDGTITIDSTFTPHIRQTLLQNIWLLALHTVYAKETSADTGHSIDEQQ